MKKVLLFPAIFAAAMTVMAACSEGTGKASDAAEADSETTTVADSAAVRAKADSMTFAFVGDIMPGTTFPDTPKGAYLPSDSGKTLFADCRELLLKADVAAGNCEGVLMEPGSPSKDCHNPKLCFTFRIPPYMTGPFTDAGFDFMNMANNHSEDFFSAGTKSTFARLTEAGIASAGIEELNPTAVIERNGRKIGFAGFSTGGTTPSVIDIEEARRIVGELAKTCDIVVVAVHAGAEGTAYQHVPRKMEIFHGWQRGDVYKFAHAVIDAGADIVWGHGPHVVRGAELYKDRLVMYSLGNFCTPFRMNVTGSTGVAPLITMTTDGEGRFLGGQIHSFRQVKRVGPRHDPSGTAATQIKSLSEADFPESPLRITSTGALTR